MASPRGTRFLVIAQVRFASEHLSILKIRPGEKQSNSLASMTTKAFIGSRPTRWRKPAGFLSKSLCKHAAASGGLEQARVSIVFPRPIKSARSKLRDRSRFTQLPKGWRRCKCFVCSKIQPARSGFRLSAPRMVWHVGKPRTRSSMILEMRRDCHRQRTISHERSAKTLSETFGSVLAAAWRAIAPVLSNSSRRTKDYHPAEFNRSIQITRDDSG